MSTFFATLEEFGAIPAGLHSFDEEAPALLPYATLVDARRAEDPEQDLEALRGVYEWQDSPLVFLIDGDRLRDDDHLRRVRRMVALRGDAPYIGVVRPGQLVVHRVGLDDDPPDRTRIPPLQSGEKQATFAWLGSLRPKASLEGRRGQWISKVVLDLLGESVDALADSGLESRHDALSLTGRALFVRFLGWEQKWDFLDFAHIPVGVLSQAYEHHLRTFAPKKQSKEGVFYSICSSSRTPWRVYGTTWREPSRAFPISMSRRSRP